jgi:hypothetical protein
MGLTGLEPVTLRLSSACSNQLSYRPEENDLAPVSSVIAGNDLSVHGVTALVTVRLRPVVLNSGSHVGQISSTKSGGKGTRTPDL